MQADGLEYRQIKEAEDKDPSVEDIWSQDFFDTITEGFTAEYKEIRKT